MIFLYRNECSADCIIISPWMSMLLNGIRPFCNWNCNFIRCFVTLLTLDCKNFVIRNENVFRCGLVHILPKSPQWFWCITRNTSNAFIKLRCLLRIAFSSTKHALVTISGSKQSNDKLFCGVWNPLQINTWYIYILRGAVAFWYTQNWLFSFLLCYWQQT